MSPKAKVLINLWRSVRRTERTFPTDKKENGVNEEGNSNDDPKHPCCIEHCSEFYKSALSERNIDDDWKQMTIG